MSAEPDFDLLRQGFVPEMRDLLEKAGSALLALETGPGDADAVNELFRVVHTIKGTAGMFDLTLLVELVHAAEDLLGAVRDGKVTLSAWIADDMLAMFDKILLWVDDIDATGRLPTGSADFVREKAERYRSYLGAPKLVAVTEAPKADALPDWIDDPVRDALAKLSGELQLIRYIPPEGCFFTGDDPLLTVAQMPGLAWSRITPAKPWTTGPDFDPYACNLIFDMISTAPRAEVEERLRYVLTECRISTLTQPARRPGGTPDHPLLPVAREILATQVRLLDLGTALPSLDSVRSTLQRALASVGLTDEGLEAALQKSARSGKGLALAQWIDAHLPPIPGAAPPEAEAAVTPPPEPIAMAEDQPAPPPPPAVPAAQVPDRAPDRTPDRALKIEPAKIDALVNLVGELIVAKNALPFLASRADRVFGSRELSREIKDQYGVIDRIAQEMQGAVMSIRMLPVSEMFKRFPRLVRDIARKLEKQVDLVLEGEQTEADKTVIEALADPMVHIIRNSLDHGIEQPAARRAAGKPETARLLIRAAQEGDSVVIEIIDDGAGIDPARIRAHAVKKGVISAEKAEALTDAEAVQLVFYPGFSTAAVVSDLSGRGVGMDAVRSTVEGFGGSVTLSSIAGQGTQVSLRLPLSMAVTRVMTVEVDGQLYGVPMDQVAETVRIPAERIRRIKQSEAFMLREALVPIVRLRARLALPSRPATEEAILVVRLNGAPIGLLIDAFHSGMEVILKPMTGILQHAPGYAGTAVLGDGKVLLILNLKELV